MVPRVIWPDKNLQVSEPVAPGSVTATLGMAPLAVTRALAAKANTSVPYVAPLRTTPKGVKSSPDLLIINTPFIPDEWERMLNDISPFNKFSDVPIGMRFGFDMGVHSPPLVTYTPPNHNSALDYPDHVLSHIRNELSLRRYSGPFSRSRLQFLIGPFRSSPLGTVPKSIDSTERRIVQDLSFPRNDPTRSSVNDQIDIENFRCDWGTFNDIRTIVMDAPDGAEAATLDVDSAFRCCPIIPSQQQSFIVHWDDAYYIDHNAPFGATSAGGVFGRVADAKSAILSSKKLGPSKNWVDDFVFFRFPLFVGPDPPVFPYSLSDIYTLAKRLGWPWKESKTRPFASEFKYLGFVWDLSSKTVQIPTAKKLRYLSKIQPWCANQKFLKKEVESVLGTLVHCSLAIPDGRSHLPSISRFAASFNFLSSPFVRKAPSKTVLTDIDWWRAQLSAEFAGSVLSRPPLVSPIEFWVDASSSWGIGVVFDNEWDSWKFVPNWNTNGRNIGWAEIVAIELGLLFAVHRGFSDVHFLIKSDNQGVIHAIEGGRSRSPEQNLVLQRITTLLAHHRLWISSLYVPSLNNLADPPSRGLPASARSRASSSFTLPMYIQPLLSRAPVLI
jgi:Reverse transcriptase-like